MQTIYAYNNYRVYLKDQVQWLKVNQASFSYRYFAKKAGFSSPNFLLLVIQGKRNLSEASIERFAEVLKLGTKEAKFFEILVHYEQAKDPALRQKAYEDLLAFPEYQKIHHLEKQEYEFLRQWYFPLILELTSVHDFVEDINWIQQKIAFPLKPKQIKKTLEILQKLGFLVKNDAGKLASKAVPISTGDEARDIAAYQYHQEILELSKTALQIQEREQREYAAMTMAVSAKQVQMIKSMIRDFRKTVISYLSKPEDRTDAVYQLNLQFFSLTQQSNTERGIV